MHMGALPSALEAEGPEVLATLLDLLMPTDETTAETTAESTASAPTTRAREPSREQLERMSPEQFAGWLKAL